VDEPSLVTIEQDDVQNEEEEIQVDLITRLQEITELRSFWSAFSAQEKFFKDNVPKW